MTSEKINQIKEELKQADGFFKEENYSNAYFCYFRALKFMAELYVESVAEGNKDVKPEDALEFIASKGMFKLNPNLVKELKEKFEKFIFRKHLTKQDCIELQKYVNKLKKELSSLIS